MSVACLARTYYILFTPEQTKRVETQKTVQWLAPVSELKGELGNHTPVQGSVYEATLQRKQITRGQAPSQQHTTVQTPSKWPPPQPPGFGNLGKSLSSQSQIAVAMGGNDLF